MGAPPLILRLAALVCASVLVGGCIPPIAPDPGDPDRPMAILVLDVTNHSAESVALGYEFEASGSAGSGIGEIPPCHHMTGHYGAIEGRYRVRVADEFVAEGQVPDEMRRGFIAYRVVIGPDGSVGDVDDPQMTLAAPEAFSQPIEGCE